MVTRLSSREHLVIRIAHCAVALLTWTGGRAAPLAAQFSIDANGLSVHYDGVDALQGARLAPSVRYAGERLYLEARGNGVQFSDATWSLDGGALLGWRPLGQRALTPEFAAAAGLGAAKGSEGTSALSALGRLHHTVGSLDLFGGAGVARNDGVLGPRTITNGEAGATWSTGRALASASYAPAWSDGVRYGDLSLYLRWEGPVILDATAGVRRITTPVTESHDWIGASAEVPLGARLTLVATGGSFPGDPAAGFPGGRYLSLGLRLGRNERTILRSDARGAFDRPLPWPGAAFEVRPGDGDTREIVVTAPGAGTVEIAGDFTDWRPVALTRDGSRWRLRLPVPPGVHRLNLRIDGGAWQVPPGIGRGSDEFGGEVGILTID